MGLVAGLERRGICQGMKKTGRYVVSGGYWTRVAYPNYLPLVFKNQDHGRASSRTEEALPG